MDVNINGVFFCASAVVQSMRKRRFGRIINISSASVHRGTKNYLHYVTSKSALIGMTNSLARELGADGITVNCIRPGTVATEVAERVAEPHHRNSSAEHRPAVHTTDDSSVGSCRPRDVPGHACRKIYYRPDYRLRRWLHPQLLTGHPTRRSYYDPLWKTLYRRSLGRAGEFRSEGAYRSVYRSPFRDRRHWGQRRRCR